jgi:hypothetical protein
MDRASGSNRRHRLRCRTLASRSDNGLCDDRPGDSDFLLCGWTVTDPYTLFAIAANSPIADDESAIRLPARMPAILLEALHGQSAAVQRVDRGDDVHSGASGDTRHLHAV